MLKFKTLILIIGDIILLYFSLFLTLLFRYGAAKFGEPLFDHLTPFSVIFILWIFIFYLTDLYEIRALKKGIQLIKNFSGAVLISAVVSVIFFYLFAGFFELTPKTNLAVFSAIFALLDLGWRFLFIKSKQAGARLFIVGNSEGTAEIISCVKNNPQLGYELVEQQKAEKKKDDLKDIGGLAKEGNIDIIVIPSHLVKNSQSVMKLIYRLLPFQIKIISSSDFYEMIFQKVPLEELEEGWFVEKITTRRKAYDLIKRVMDFVLASLIGVILSPLALIIIALIKLSPRKGGVIFKQKRVGLNNKVFTLYKFGTMHEDKGDLWTNQNDKRLTSLGKFLRYTHLDEIPQLWNILKGDISFIGPRPERVELAEKYGELPYYDIRHIIKPGLTGWAQVNFRPSASLEEAFEKLKYDIYYIKNRSFVLDLLIIVKTIRRLFIVAK